ncbi:MAG TPA: Rieske (2Fe-2S) protein [Pseudonocardia sp.]|jgi:3-phenylpropionate/trans-cinnamate dioxygenase ferredoxin subunit|nr:Rieske (2Fe-2S) protein [Pseudonocardia sp.]
MTNRPVSVTASTAICPVEDLLARKQVCVELPSGERCLVVASQGELYAVSAVCTHRELSLEGALIRGTSLVCPWHRARFDLVTGKGTRPAPGPLKTYEVTVVDAVVHVHERDGA